MNIHKHISLIHKYNIMNRILILFTVLFLTYSCHDKDVAKINLSGEEQYSLIALEKDYKLSDEVATKILTDFISGNGLASCRSTSIGNPH